MDIHLNLEKVFPLAKEVKKVAVSLGWDMFKDTENLQTRFLKGDAADLDLSCFIVDTHKKIVDTISYRQLRSADGCVVHSGDNETGEGDGDDEIITVDLYNLPSYISALIFTVTTFTGQSFQDIENAFCRIVDRSHNQELMHYTLSTKGIHTAVIVVKLYRDNSGKWFAEHIDKNTDAHSAEALLLQIVDYL